MEDECCVIREKGMCLVCGKKGHTTGRDVPSLHLKSEALAKTSGWKEVSVCLNPDCEVLYFEGSQWISHKESRTRVGYKEKESPHPLCYCFNHTGEEFLEQIRTQGKPVAVDDIKRQVKAGTCRCEVTNPTGGCCLATINEYLKRNNASVDNPILLKPLNTKGGLQIKTLGILSALAASACCLGPLVLAALGLGGLGLGRYLGAAHWYLTVAGFALVVFGFHRYFKEKKACAAHGCAMPGEKVTLTILILAALFISGFTLWESGIFSKAPADACCVVQNNGVGGTEMKSSKKEPVVDVADGSTIKPLFKAVLQYRSDSPSDTVVPSKGREGTLIGSGDGTASGQGLQGKVQWSLWAGDCLYPLIRKGQKVPDSLHLCTMNPVGFIKTEDGAEIRFEGRGYGLRRPEKYRTSLTLVFSTEDARYAWLTKVLGVMDGEFDEKTGRAVWNVYTPIDGDR